MGDSEENAHVGVASGWTCGKFYNGGVEVSRKPCGFPQGLMYVEELVLNSEGSVGGHHEVMLKLLPEAALCVRVFYRDLSTTETERVMYVFHYGGTHTVHDPKPRDRL